MRRETFSGICDYQLRWMVPNTRKELERLFFNILKQQVSDFPEGDVVEGESPDFVIRGLEGTLGVEVTRLFKRSGEG